MFNDLNMRLIASMMYISISMFFVCLFHFNAAGLCATHGERAKSKLRFGAPSGGRYG